MLCGYTLFWNNPTVVTRWSIRAMLLIVDREGVIQLLSLVRAMLLIICHFILLTLWSWCGPFYFDLVFVFLMHFSMLNLLSLSKQLFMIKYSLHSCELIICWLKWLVCFKHFSKLQNELLSIFAASSGHVTLK